MGHLRSTKIQKLAEEKCMLDLGSITWKVISYNYTDLHLNTKSISFQFAFRTFPMLPRPLLKVQVDLVKCNENQVQFISLQNDCYISTVLHPFFLKLKPAKHPCTSYVPIKKILYTVKI